MFYPYPSLSSHFARRGYPRHSSPDAEVKAGAAEQEPLVLTEAQSSDGASLAVQQQGHFLPSWHTQQPYSSVSRGSGHPVPTTVMGSPGAV